MIYGDGVQVKFCAIIEGRETELMQGAVTTKDKEIANDELMMFRHTIRQCKPSEFNEWYESYKDFQPQKTIRLR
jgi:hypothetical protein